jgi:hypothetical protein
MRVGKKNLQKSKLENVNIECIGFDGRKDDTLAKKGTEKEEHYVLMKEPGSLYLDHVSPDQGTAKCIAEEILTFVIDSQSTETLNGLLCDGTPVNTGRHGGVLKLIEIHLGRSVQWLVCLLHANELPFRHIFESIYGKTTGPTTFKGVFGAQLKTDVWKLDVVSFKRIEGNVQDIPQDVVKDLSNDQKYYEMCLAVQSGAISEKLANRVCGAVHHARWLTRANRILRLYVSTPNPETNLLELVNVIMKSYAPGWFQIKSHPNASDGARNFWHLIVGMRKLEPKHRIIMERVLQTNAYFAHPENILLSMVTDSRRHIREWAIQKIMLVRVRYEGTRNFVLPTLKFDAVDYTELIDWTVETVTPPPLMNKWSNADLLQARKAPLILDKFPCHSQRVESAVNLVTKASTKDWLQ